MVGDEDERKSRQINEIRRRIDHQVEKTRHIEIKANSVLRLITSILLVILTGISVTASTGYLGEISFPINNQAITSLSDKIIRNSSFLSQYDSGYVEFSLLAVYSFLLTYSAWGILWKPLDSTRKILKTSSIQSGIDIDSIQGRPETLKKYEEQFENNAAILDKTTDLWNECLDHLVRGSVALILLIIMTAVLHISKPVYILYIMLVSIIYVGIVLRDVFDWDHIKGELRPNTSLDLPAVGIIAGLLIVDLAPEIIRPIGIIFSSIALMIVIANSIRQRLDSVRSFSGRSIMFGYLSIFNFGIINRVYIPIGHPRYWVGKVLFNVGGALVICGLIAGLIFFSRRVLEESKIISFLVERY